MSIVYIVEVAVDVVNQLFKTKGGRITNAFGGVTCGEQIQNIHGITTTRQFRRAKANAFGGAIITRAINDRRNRIICSSCFRTILQEANQVTFGGRNLQIIYFNCSVASQHRPSSKHTDQAKRQTYQ